MSGNIPDFDEYDEVIRGTVHGRTDYGDEMTAGDRYGFEWRRRLGKTCRYPGCEEAVTHRADYCPAHRQAGRVARAMVRQLVARKASREQVGG